MAYGVANDPAQEWVALNNWKANPQGQVNSPAAWQSAGFSIPAKQTKSRVGSLLSSLPSWDGSASPLSVSAATKSPTIGAATSGAWNQLNSQVASQQQPLADFVRNFYASDPAAKANLNQENTALGGFYNGGVLGDLNRLTNRSAGARNAVLQQAIGSASRGNNLLRQQQGNSSFADQQLLNTVGQLASQGAVMDANERRNNYLTQLQGQQGLAGQRNRLLNDYLGRNLVPIQAQQQVFGNDLANMGSLANLENQNTVYNVQTPEQLIAQRLGLLGQGQNLTDVATSNQLAQQGQRNQLSMFPTEAAQAQQNLLNNVWNYGNNQTNAQLAQEAARNQLSLFPYQQQQAQLGVAQGQQALGAGGQQLGIQASQEAQRQLSVGMDAIQRGLIATPDDLAYYPGLTPEIKAQLQQYIPFSAPGTARQQSIYNQFAASPYGGGYSGYGGATGYGAMLP